MNSYKLAAKLEKRETVQITGAGSQTQEFVMYLKKKMKTNL